MSEVYYTNCCDFRFIRKNHCPVGDDGSCRNCGEPYKGQTQAHSKSIMRRKRIMEKVKK